jgi:hypothetical protein
VVDDIPTDKSAWAAYVEAAAGMVQLLQQDLILDAETSWWPPRFGR